MLSSIRTSCSIALLTILALISFAAPSVVAVDRDEDVSEEPTIPDTPPAATVAPPAVYIPSKDSDSLVNVAWNDMDGFLRRHPLAIVAIYSHECGACIIYMPEFDRAVEEFQQLVSSGAAPKTGLIFARVDAIDADRDWILDKRVKSFPTVRLFANNAFSQKNLQENARVTADIVQLLTRLSERLATGGTPTLSSEVALRTVIDEEVKALQKTLILVQFASETAPPQADPIGEDTVSLCRLAFAAGMVELIELDFLVVHTTATDGISNAAKKLISSDVTLQGFQGQHPDYQIPCHRYSQLIVLRCLKATANESCTMVGGSMPIPTTTDEFVRAVVTHGIPPAMQITPKNNDVLSKVWIDRTIPQSSAMGFHERRIGRRTRPTLIYFAELKACEEDSHEFRWARYIKRSMRSVATSYPNITVLVADQYEFNTWYLRLGFKRHHSRDGIAFGIYDDGLRYSSLMHNYTSFSTQIIKDFIDKFNGGFVPPYITAVKHSSSKEGPKVSNQVSSLDFFKRLWRIDEPTPAAENRIIGGIDDLPFVVFANKHCNHCKDLIANYEHLVDARRRRLLRVGKEHASNSATNQFLPVDPRAMDDVPHVDYATRSRDEHDTILEGIVDGTAPHANILGDILERMQLFFINGTENFPISESWVPVSTSILQPNVGVCARVSRIAFDAQGRSRWEVTAHNPQFMDFLSTRYVHVAPTALEMFSLAVDEWRRHLGFRLRVVRQ